MPLDFRADRVQTEALIADRSSGAKLIIYPSDAKLDNNGGIDPVKLPPAQYEADDVFIFISGSIGGLGGVDNGVSVFGGDVYVSGSLAGKTLIFNNLVGEQVMVNFVPILNVDQVLGQKVYFSQVGDIATYSGQVEYKSAAPGNSVLTINLSANGLVEVPSYTGEISGVSSTHYAESTLAMGTNSNALIYEESGDQYIYIISDSVGADGVHSTGFTISFRNPMGSASGGGGGGGGGDASDWAMYPAVQNVDLDGNKLTGLGGPTNPQDAATKGYVDAELGFKANTADLGTAAYEDVVSDEDDTTPGQLITTEWRGLDLTKRWQLPEASGGWYKFATVRGSSWDYHGVFFIDQLRRSLDGPLSARIEFNGNAIPAGFRARSFVSGFTDTRYGDIAYQSLGGGVFDLYVLLGGNVDPVVEFTGSPDSLINTDPIPGADPLPPDAVIVPRAIDWNSLSMGQTWRDETANRSLGTNYINTTGRPIHVSVILTPDTGATSPNAGILVDGNIIAQSKASAASGQPFLNVYSIVPAGSTFMVITLAGDQAAVIYRWMEYR